jgi:lysophospholipase L1-like esterase
MNRSDSRTRSIANKTIRYLVAAVAMMGAALVLVEIGVRLLSGTLGISPYMQYDARLGWTAQPNAIKRHRDRSGQFDVTYQINEYGYRGPAYPVAGDPDTFRVIVLGDSTGFGWGVAEAETFSSIIDREVDNLEVINLALSGYGTDQSYLRFVEEGIRFGPDLIVLQVSHNDFEEIMHPFFNQKPKPHFRLTQRGDLELQNVPPAPIGERARLFHSNSLPVPFKEWLGWHSYAFNLLNEVYYGMRRSPMTTSAVPANIYTPESIALFNAIIRMLNDKASEVEARVVLVFSTKAISTNRLLEPDQVPVLDLYPDFLSTGLGDDTKLYFSDGYHWNPAGHRVAADKLKRFILDLQAAM